MQNRIQLKFGLVWIVVVGLLIIVTITSQAQLNRGGTPWSFQEEPTQTLSIDLVLTPPDLDAVAEEDLLHPVPYRFAINIPVDVGISPQSAVLSPQFTVLSPQFTVHGLQSEVVRPQLIAGKLPGGWKVSG